MLPLAKNIRVALVLDSAYGAEIISLCKAMPAWVIESPQNLAVIEKLRSATEEGMASTVTTFPKRDDESLGAVCQRIVQSLDQHHDEYSQSPAYNELDVIGVSLGDISLAPFLDLGFSEFLQTSNGFVARKGSVVQ